jgi:outer membrane protein
MKQMKTFLIAAVLFAGTLVTSAQTKVGHIDVSKLMEAMPEMKAAEAQLKKMNEQYDADYNKMVQEYQTKAAQYEKEAATQTEAINQTRSQEMQDMGSRIQKFRDTASKDLQSKGIELQKPLMEKAQAAIQKIARAKGIQYVLDVTPGSGIILAEGTDLLEDVKKDLGIK